MSHSCKSLILHCIDFRFGKTMKAHMEQHGFLGNCDIVSVAGAAKNIASPAEASDRAFILRQIDIAERLHHIREVVLVNHTDCGAYGGKRAFPSEAEEKKFHLLEMEKAKRIILEAHPTLSVRTFLAEITESGAVAIRERGQVT